MDSSVLCGDFKAPKFIICDKCNRRGHRANECPSKLILSCVTHTHTHTHHTHYVTHTATNKLNDIFFLLEIETQKPGQPSSQSISDKTTTDKETLDEIISSALMTVSGK